MTLEELEAKRKVVENNFDKTLSDMQKTIDESYRVIDLAHNSRKILDDLDAEFERQTELQGNDIYFLFVAIGLQMIRVFIVNELTKIEKAGSANRNETRLHNCQEKILKKFDSGEHVKERPYYASMEHIITKMGVPYDATSTLNENAVQRMRNKSRSWDFDLDEMIAKEKLSLFKGANHRFATLGHDPIWGLVFGTANIMTNTITCVEKPLLGEKFSIPKLTTNHVVFTSDYKDPHIGAYASTLIMLQQMVERTQEQPATLVASLIKQLIHIGTDLYTPYGIQIPAANLVLSKKSVEELTKYISTGDILKVGISAKTAEVINLLISAVHTLMYDTSMPCTKDVYNVRTRKIIMYSNVIATSSNILWNGGKMMSGEPTSFRQVDIGGLMNTLNRLRNDGKFIRQIKEEFVFGGFGKMIQGPI